MDTCDGLAGGRTLQQRREIMRDSRIGAFGAIGAFCLLLLKYVSLEGLTESSRFGALVLMPALGRWTAVFSIYAFPYARGEGLGRAFKDQATWPILVVATAFVVGVSVGFLALKGLALVAGVGLVSLVVAAVLSHRFAGLTGDNYGAVTEVAEVVALLLVIAIPAWSW
jgi:adenosylcobinamide-GDP ribazoletransferase